MNVLTVQDLSVVYETEQPFTAVRGVSLELRRGEILGLAGESGCGKTTLAYAVNRLHQPPARITGGSVIFHDREGQDIDLLALKDEALRKFRWSQLSMVFQGAMNSLNPVRTVGYQLDDTLRAHDPSLSRSRRGSGRPRC